VRIAVDAMGGDYAPQEIIKGAVTAAVEEKIKVVLVGKENVVRSELGKYDYPSEYIEILDAPEVIEMDEHPAKAVRKKKNSSLVVATRLVKEGRAAAIVSAGNTGAQMAAALFELGRLPGIERPGIATVFPTPSGGKVLIDSGANVDCSASNLVQFAYLGSAYASQVLGIPDPRVALLNIGTEPTKGNEAVVAAFKALEKDDNINFWGNLEGRDFFTAEADVIVCDGFVGNVVLKLTEGIVTTLFSLLREEIVKNPLRKLGGALVKPGFREIFRKLDHTEYGGAPLLGVQGISIICHGSSRAKSIYNALRYARDAVENGFLEVVMKKLQVMAK